MHRILYYQFEKGHTKFALDIPIGAQFLDVLKLRRRQPMLAFSAQEDADTERAEFYVASQRAEVPDRAQYLGKYRINRPGLQFFFVFVIPEAPDDGDENVEDGDES